MFYVACLRPSADMVHRTRRKLQLLYNIQNGSTPYYLLDLFPQQSKVRLFIPFEMATILLFHSVDYL
jgi:hypothetical protein